jgi:hypothetical protein
LVLFSRKISILSAYFAQIQTMDARDTLKYTIGVNVVAENVRFDATWSIVAADAIH